MAEAKSAPSDVERVLASPRVEQPPKTLEEARSAPGRAERIAEIAARIESEGIEYVYFQQVSITGRVMGKGVVSSFFPQVAERGYQLVYGATANLFTDREGNYIGFGPEESELAAIADLDTFKVLPWDERVARVYCDCYDTETGELLDADPRQNLKRVVSEFEEELGLNFLIGIEPEMMWLRRTEDGGAEGVTKPYCYHIHMFEELRPVLLDVVSLRPRAGARHELRRPRGRARASSSSTSASTGRAPRRTTSRPTGRSSPRWDASTTCSAPSCRSRSPASRPTATTTTSRWSTTTATTSSTIPMGPPSSRRPGRHFLGGMLDHFGALMCVGNPTVNSYCRMWDYRVLGADLQELGLAEPDLHGPGRVRRAVRVPRRRLVLQPVSDRGGAA